MTAWQSGVKGITVYRKGSRNEVLSDTPTPVSTVVAKPEVKQVEEVSTLLDCKRITFRANSHRILMHIGFHPKTHQLIELAIRHGKTDPDLDSMGQALGILVSIALQEGMSPERIARTMRGIRSGWSARIRLHENDAKTVLVTSVPDAASLFMMRYLQSKGQEKELVDIDGAEICISCNCRAVVHENGCEVCKSCGISRCS
jgi:ribonucleoside-diphosphate reductase alpha chain